MSLSFDLMDLTDIGGQPLKLAGELHRQIRAQLQEVPLPVPLENIATALGIEEIVDKPTDSFEGMLVAAADRSRGAIILRKGLPMGRRNFTLGHEIGHFVNPYHKAPPSGFVCNKTAMSARRQGGGPWDKRTALDRMEVEANEFSARLSVPVDEFRRERSHLPGSDLSHVKILADRFGLSKEAMARIYVDTSPENIAILFSQHGLIQRFILPLKFPYLGLAKGHSLPSNSRSSIFRKGKGEGQISDLDVVESEVWLNRNLGDQTVFEQILIQQNGWAITLLSVEEEENSDDESDPGFGRDGPKFAYGR